MENERPWAAELVDQWEGREELIPLLRPAANAAQWPTATWDAARPERGRK